MREQMPTRKRKSADHLTPVPAQPSQNCDILPWSFAVFASQAGRSDVQEALDSLTEYGKAFFERQVVYLAGTANRSDWREPQAKRLRGYTELYEIRFLDGNKATRALGFFGPVPRLFTITVVATHKQNVYSPREAFDIADRRRKAICAGDAAYSTLLVDGEEFPPVPE